MQQGLIQHIYTAKRILITGDPARGKTTFANELAGMLGIPCYSTDTYLWKKKFTIEHDKEEARMKLKEIYNQENWIVEGTTKELIEDGVVHADIIFYFVFRSLVAQWVSILRRMVVRKEDTLVSALRLMRHVLYRRFHLGYMRGVKTVEDLVADDKRTVYIYSFREWNELLEQIGQASR